MELQVGVNCPACERKMEVKLGEMVPGRSKSCPNCGATIRFSGDDGRQTQKAMDDFQRNLKRLF